MKTWCLMFDAIVFGEKKVFFKHMDIIFIFQIARRIVSSIFLICVWICFIDFQEDDGEMDFWLLRRSARQWPSSQIMQQITASPSKEGFQVSNPLIWAAAHMRHQSTGLAFVHRCHSTWDNESWPLHFPCTLDQASSFVKTSEPASDLCWTLEILKSWNPVLFWKVLTHVYSSCELLF